MKKLFLGVSILLWTGLQGSEECPAILQQPIESKQYGELRTKSIKGWDKLLTWAFLSQNRPYVLMQPPVQTIYKRPGEHLANFDKNYGYFSIYHPLVGIVTDSDEDIKVVQCLLSTVDSQFAIDEILSKILAYRTLKKGMKITIANLGAYIVDEVIDLWRGMPAYGLIPENGKGAIPILLFRGTDLDLVSEKGWASILSDLDIAGPGHKTFLRAQQEIHDWLTKVQASSAPARVVGFSLGGVFVLYTLIYEHELINKQIASTAFNPPGVSQQILDMWEKMPSEKRPPHVTYVNQGDFVSQIGFFLGNVHEISLEQPMEVIEAHVTFISGAPLFKINAVDVPKENQERK